MAAWRDLFRIGRKSASTLDILREIYGGRASTSGKTVNLQTALGVSTVFACARLIGNGMAQVPLKLMREATDASGRVTRLPAKDHPLFDLLGRRPNQWQTSFEFRQVMSWHTELAGNFYAFRNAPAGVVRELIPFQPGEVVVKRNPDMTLRYEVTSAETGKMTPFPPEAIWHVRGPSWNSWTGIDWLQVARDAIGLAIATEESQASLHKNGVRTTGVYSMEGTLKEGQYDALRKWIDREHAGAASAGRPMILDRAAKWLATQMTGVDAQHLETRRNQVEEICRFFGVMPMKVGFSDKATTYASAEQLALGHLMDTLAPRWSMYEQSMDVNLLTEKERMDGLYFDFVEEGMIRGSVKDTTDAIIQRVNGGLMSANEGRAALDLNPDDDPESDELRIPVNVAQAPEPAPDPEPAMKALEDLRVEVKALRDRPQPETKISVDARTTIEEGALQVAPAAVSVDARTSIEAGAIKLDVPVTSNTTVEPTEVKLDAQMHTHVPGAQVKTEIVIPEVKITAMPARESESTTERDADGNIKRVKQSEKDA